MKNAATNLSAEEIRKQNYRNYLKNSKLMEKLISSICIFGILVCLYAFQVEIHKSKDKGYVAYCDISSFISCSKVFTSKLIF